MQDISENIPGANTTRERPDRPRAVPAELADRLLGLAGGRVQLVDSEPHVGELLGRGREFAADRLRMRRRKPRGCHGNAARLWYESGGSTRIVTGYALRGEIWLQHSWGLDGGRVVETTVRFDRYFGVELTTRESLAFAFANVPGLVQRLTEDIKAGRASPVLVREIDEINQEIRARPGGTGG